MAKLTVKEIESLRRQARTSGKPKALSESNGRGAGVLRVRVHPGGTVTFFYRYTDGNGRRDDLPLGAYAPDARGGLTLEGARARAGELMVLYRGGVKDVRQYLAAREREAAERRRQQAEERARQKAGSLKALLVAYIDHLRGKASWRDVETTLTNHVIDAFPELAARRANAIGPADLMPVFDRLAKRGHTRTLGKVRSFLHAAYSMAQRAPFDATIPATFRAFAITANPAAPLPTYGELSRPGDRVLTPAELRTLLAALTDSDTMAARALLVAIRLGGQRPAQLLRVTAEDVDTERGTITLRDGKGRRTHARLHVLPLAPVQELVAGCLAINAKAPSLFSSDGRRPPDPSTLSALVRSISRGAYRMGDIRRTCETELARLGVSKDLRAQLLSHGIGGVQDQHYDRHLYIDEKREALDKWRIYLDGVTRGSVVPIGRPA